MLSTIMEMQRDLQKRLGTDFTKLSDEECAAFMRNHRGYLEDELAEALYEMPNYKLWKDYGNMSDEARAYAWQKVRMELIDALHFFVNLLLCAGFTAEEVYDMYVAKNKENHRRQDEGYTSDVSYRDQAVEDVLNEEPTCTVVMDGEACGSNDFIAVLNMNDGESTVYYNTDALSLGMAAKMIIRQFNEALSKCSEDERKEINAILNGGALDE